LTTYVRREIAYLAATEDVGPDDVDIEEVVDDTIVRALANAAARPPSLALDRWLISLANQSLSEQVTQTHAWHGEAEDHEDSVERGVPRRSPAQMGSAVEDDMYYWYQPDEDLRVEDIVADPHTLSPEEIAARQTLKEDLDQAVAYLPKPWRDVFVLHSIEDFTLGDVALVTGRTVDEVQRDFQAACAFLRDRLAKPQTVAHGA
jgi:RNA polymerase sigma factor (sigma-70 family)